MLAGPMLALSALTACGDSFEPQTEFDAEATRDVLETVLYPVESANDLLLALDLAVFSLDGYDSSLLLADLAASPLMRPTTIRESGTRWIRRAEYTARETLPSAAIRSEAGSEADASDLSDASSALRVPSYLRGETLDWDTQQGYYVTGRSGAPVDGVRLLWYRMSSSSGYPLEPRSRLGHIDLIDVGGSSSDAVRVRAVRTDGRDRVVADYTVRLTGGGTSDEGVMEITADGALGDDAGTVDLDVRQRLSWDRYADREELVMEYDYRRSGRVVSLDGVARTRFDDVEWDTFRFDLYVRGGRQADTRIEADIDRDGSLDGRIRSGGRDVVRISGWDGDPEFRRTDGRQPGEWELYALRELWTGITDLIWLTDWVVVPVELLVWPG